VDDDRTWIDDSQIPRLRDKSDSVWSLFPDQISARRMPEDSYNLIRFQVLFFITNRVDFTREILAGMPLGIPIILRSSQYAEMNLSCTNLNCMI